VRARAAVNHACWAVTLRASWAATAADSLATDKLTWRRPHERAGRGPCVHARGDMQDRSPVVGVRGVAAMPHRGGLGRRSSPRALQG
jgi:hypothetical protein